MKFQVRGGTGPNVGLLEFEVFGVPSAPDAPYRVTVEGTKVSWTPPRFDGGAPVLSYVVRGYTGGALVTSKEVTGLETTMPAAEEYRVAAVNVIGTGPERGEPVLAERIDVSGPDVLSEPGASAPYTATFTPADTTYKDVTWSVTEPDGAPTYKAEISADGVLRVNRLSGPVLVVAEDENGVRGEKRVTIDIDPDAIRENAALWPGVTAQASSVFSSAFGADRVRDGFGAGSADWASAGETNPWVELRWPSPITADRVVLFDRTSGDDANGGVLQFGDGSTVEVTGIPGNGSAKRSSSPGEDVRPRCASRCRAAAGRTSACSSSEVYARREPTTCWSSARCSSSSPPTAPCGARIASPCRSPAMR